MLSVILATWTGEDIEPFGGIDEIAARRGPLVPSCTAHPLAPASAAAKPKLSYREVERKIIDSCI